LPSALMPNRAVFVGGSKGCAISHGYALSYRDKPVSGDKILARNLHI